MSSKKINITIPEETLKEIDKFCDEEGLTKSLKQRLHILQLSGRKENWRKKERI